LLVAQPNCYVVNELLYIRKKFSLNQRYKNIYLPVTLKCAQEFVLVCSIYTLH